MHFFNKHLFYFILAVIAYSFIFRFALSYGITKESHLLTWGAAVIYFFALFFTAREIGKAYYTEYLGNDLGFTWHAVTFVFATLVGYVWLKYGQPATYESLSDLWRMTTGWGIGLMVHFIIFLFGRTKNIKGISKDEIFD